MEQVAWQSLMYVGVSGRNLHVSAVHGHTDTLLRHTHRRTWHVRTWTDHSSVINPSVSALQLRAFTPHYGPC
eukprot:1695805-Amphidinium_carterae.1